jgi:hypothetical protein
MGAGPEPCPHCGAMRDGGVRGSGVCGGGVPERRRPLDALYDEVARIREIAERQESERETIARLTHEVQMLRETVARLRGTSHRAAAAVRTQRLRTPAA